MAWLSAAAPYVEAATTVLSAYSAIKEGKERQAQAGAVASERAKQANQAQLEAQTEAFNQRRKAKLVRSRALAVAGASGAGVNDPTVNNILDDIDTEGEYGALTSMASGNYLARGLRAGAGAARREGRAERSAGYMSGASTALSGTVGWFEKYG